MTLSSAPLAMPAIADIDKLSEVRGTFSRCPPRKAIVVLPLSTGEWQFRITYVNGLPSSRDRNCADCSLAEDTNEAFASFRLLVRLANPRGRVDSAAGDWTNDRTHG